MRGQCHCGAVEITVSRPPTAVTECGCTICRRYGALWSYYPRAEVAITGRTETYARGRRRIDFHRCPTCGCVVSWQPRGANYPECAVNARMFDEIDLSTIERFVEDDASVQD